MTFNLKALYHTVDSQPDQIIELSYSRKRVFIKPLKVKDRTELMKAIEGKDEIIINKCIDSIIEKYVEGETETIDVKQLAVQERHQILTYIRVAYSDTTATTVMHQCPKCEHLEKKVPFNFESLDLRFFEGNPLRTVKIAKSNFELDLGVIIRHEEMSAEAYNRRMKHKSVSEAQITLIASAIKNIRYIGTEQEDKSTADINEELANMSLDETVEFVENLKQSDLAIITEGLDSFNFGLKVPLDFKCSNCDYKGTEEANALLFFIS